MKNVRIWAWIFAILATVSSMAMAQQVTATDIHSKAFCLTAVFKGLQMANPTNALWSTPKLAQENFMTTYSSGAKADLPQLKDKVEAIATNDSQRLNDWFADHGFPGMNVQILQGGQAVGTVFDLLVDWKVPGQKKDISVWRGESLYDYYEGAKMLTSDHGFTGFKLDGHNYPLFQLNTRQGWQVYLVESADGDDPEAFQLPERAKALLALVRSSVDYEELNFPVVQMATDVDISWMAGMQARDFRIDEAIKKIKLHLDEKGARAESAVAFTSRGLGPPFYKIQRPFYVIFTKDGLNFPPFVALAAPDTWAKTR